MRLVHLLIPIIAFEFASWISLEFKLYIIVEFERLKRDEAYRNKIDWSVKRELAKTNYVIHTDAIKENLVPTLTDKQKKFVYADEADVLNVALFGMTAKQWRDKDPSLSGNMRDYTDILHLVVLINLENINAEMINNDIPQAGRLERLNEIARKQGTFYHIWSHRQSAVIRDKIFVRMNPSNDYDDKTRDAAINVIRSQIDQIFGDDGRIDGATAVNPDQSNRPMIDQNPYHPNHTSNPNNVRGETLAVK